MKHATLIGAAPLAHARLTGIVGVAVLASGSFAGYVASRLLVQDDMAATLANVAGSAALFRLGIAGSLAMMVAFLVYALLLHRLLQPAGRGLATAMLSLAAVSVPVYMLNQASLYALLPLARDALHAEAGRALELYRFGNAVGAIFFGLWLIPLGLLVFRCGYLPRAIGVLLTVGSLGYLVLFVQAFFFPGLARGLWSNPLLLVTHASELALMLWLLVRGVNTAAWERCASAFQGARS